MWQLTVPGNPFPHARQFMCFSGAKWQWISAWRAVSCCSFARWPREVPYKSPQMRINYSAHPPLPAGTEIQMLTWLKENTVLASPDAELNAC